MKGHEIKKVNRVMFNIKLLMVFLTVGKIY